MMAAESGATILTAFVLKRRNAHLGRLKLWTVPFAFESATHMRGAIHNLNDCLHKHTENV